MLQIFTKFSRIQRTSGQNIHQLTRSFSYKPVERNFAAITNEPIINRPRRRKKAFDEVSESRFHVNIISAAKPVDNGRSLKIIESIATDPKMICEQELLNIFEKLSHGVISDDALLHENFNTMIDATRILIPKLTVAQNVQIFTQICRAQVPMFDELSEIIVNGILQRISLIATNEIIPLDFSVREYYRREWKLSRVFETMRQATRAAFIVKANNELVDNQTYEKLIQMMRYLSNNPSLVKNIDTTSLSVQLLLMDDCQFPVNDVVCVIVSLARFPKLDEHAKQLLSKMLRIWCSKNDKLEDIKALLELLEAKKLKTVDLEAYNNELFIQHCSNAAIRRKDVRLGFDILNSFNELNLVSDDLINFLSNVFNNGKYKKLRLDDYAIFCTACAKAEYKPSNWKSRVVPAVKGAQIQGTNFYKQVDLALTLNQLGIHHEEFIEHLLKSAEIQMLYKDDSRLEEVHKAYSSQKENVTQNVAHSQNQPNLSTYMKWLTTDLEKFIGANKVLNNVTVSRDLTVPLVMKVDTKTGDFIDMQSESVNENELIIGVITQDVGSVGDDFESVSKLLIKQREQMKKKGRIAITLDESLYGSMQTYKRAFTFFKIVLYAINNRK